MNRLKKIFRNKTILILGGTGSIGSQVLKALIPFSPKIIKIFSRDEYKQYKLRYTNENYNFIEYCLGDIRDYESILTASKDCDVIFHCAALKQVSPSEEMPEEFIKTNILGSLNVKKSAIVNKVPVTISISSDKAVDPGNTMGLTKALQEKIFSSHLLKERTLGVKFINVRFGNVIGTNGSLFPILYHQITNKKILTVTDPTMTRFLMSQKEAIELIFWATLNGHDGDVVLKKMKSASIADIVKNFFEVLHVPKSYPVNYVGIRIGEKMHEYLLTEDNIYRTKEKNGYFIISQYQPSDIDRNLIGRKTKTLTDRNKFFSNYQENFMSQKEIKSYIQQFIREIKKNDYIL